MIITGVVTMGDFASSTALARSLAPLLTMTIAAYFMRNKKSNHIRITKLLTLIAVICLSCSVVFAPFWLLRGEVKSSYDVMHVAGDKNEAVVTGNGIYYFVTDHVTQTETLIISPAQTPATRFFLTNYLLPLKYQLGERIKTKTPTGVRLGDIYDNGMYTVSFYYSYGFGSLVINQSARTR